MRPSPFLQLEGNFETLSTHVYICTAMSRIAGTLLVFWFAAVRALYEDQVGTIDWYRQFVGKIDYALLDGATKQGCKRLLVASAGGVVASIDADTGDIAWRHAYENEGGVIDAVVRSKWGLVTVSRGGRLLRSWDVSSGVLRWESLTGLSSEAGQLDYPLNADWRPGGVVATLAGTSIDTVVVAMGNEVAGFSGRSGDRLWKTRLNLDHEAAVAYIQSTGSSLKILSSLENQKLYLNNLNASTGKIGQAVVLPSPWLSAGTTSCAMAGEVAVCLDSEKQDLFHTTGQRFLLSRLQNLGISGVKSLQAGEDAELFWVHSDHTHWLLDLHGNSVTVVTSTTDALSLTSQLDQESVRVGVRWWEDGDEGSWVQVVMGEEGEELIGRVKFTHKRGRPLQADVFLSRSKAQIIHYQLLLVMEDSSIVLLHTPGEIRWVREDGLGAVVAMEAVDLPPADQSGSIANFIELTKDERNPLKLALMRLQLQYSLAKEFVKNLRTRGLPTLLVSNDDLLRDQFNIRKLLVVATETGKLYGLDSSNGDVVWQRYIPNIAPLNDGTFTLHLLRSTSHPPLPPLCILIGVSMSTSCHGQVVYAFNPITGDHMTLESDDVTSESGDSHVTCLGAVKQMILLPHLDHTHSHVLLYLTQDMEVHTLPSSPESIRHISTLTEEMFLYSADVDLGLVTGYHLEQNEDKSLVTKEAWHVSYPTEFERIVTIVTKSKIEHVGSPGRVKADRSVQYKYLNPHLFVVITCGHDDTTAEKSSFSVYLVDGVTGATIYHTTHRNAAGPVNLVLSDNWIVYHYYNTKLRRYEMAVTELFEPPSNHTHTLWSSLSPPSPEVTSQGYTFPLALSTLTTTQTRKGLTHKSLIMGLHSGHIVSLPKRFLDPRRDIEPTDDMREDGLPVYSPELIIKPFLFINYNRTVSGLRSIHVAASGLESTCLVLACGLDLFFTRIMPSKQFDLLAEDFDYLLIAAVVLGLVAGTIGLSFLSKRKSLRSLWK